MDIANLVLGAVVLFLGRRLFWLFVGIAGFLFGMEFGPQVIQPASQAVLIGVAVAAGVLGALLAIFAQKVAFALGGFFAASYFATEMLPASATQPEFIALGAGVVGAVLALAMMDWGLIVLSALVGTRAVSAELTALFGWSTLFQIMSVVILFFMGVLVQGAMLSSTKAREQMKRRRAE
ncbi:MAG: hypothetical protein R3200_10345 [Xanthomonadales bacterium]|nr:hypothetical protein [Xanthomonadales bacterium]